MLKMHRNERLAWAFIMILVSSVYGILVVADALTGIAVGVGYVAIILTIFVMNEIWRHNGPKPK